jgi:hypothetical protein
MTKDDWRALLESFLADETDHESFHDDFLEAWKGARDERLPVPDVIGDLFFTVENFDPSEDDPDELRDEAEKALRKLNKDA